MRSPSPDWKLSPPTVDCPPPVAIPDACSARARYLELGDDLEKTRGNLKFKKDKHNNYELIDVIVTLVFALGDPNSKSGWVGIFSVLYLVVQGPLIPREAKRETT